MVAYYERSKFQTNTMGVSIGRIDFDVVYRPGIKNGNADADDALSKMNDQDDHYLEMSYMTISSTNKIIGLQETKSRVQKQRENVQ